MDDNIKENRWHIRMIKPFWPWSKNVLRPAEVANGLCKVVLARESTLEDANYQKIVPNRFIVELNEGNYTSNYQPIEKRVVDQWRDKLLDFLTTTNSRIGKREYRFGGAIHIELRPSPSLPPNRARVLSLIDPGTTAPPAQSGELTGCLIQSPGGKRWNLQAGSMSIGRDSNVDISLNDPVIREKRLVSGYHANLRVENGIAKLYDGTPDGKPSLNGTYVNYRRVPPSGMALQNGDIIILASVDPETPRADTPGVVTLRFWRECKE